MQIPHLLVHDHKDNLGVVGVEGLKAGTNMVCVVTHDNSSFELVAKADVPIGHKIALADLKADETAIKYGEDIGRFVADIEKVHTFPTGQGNVVGNPIVPVVKITANPRTVRTMGEHLDVDVSGILRREMTIDEAGDALIDVIVRTANGRSTAAEALGHREFVMTKLYRSA